MGINSSTHFNDERKPGDIIDLEEWSFYPTLNVKIGDNDNVKVPEDRDMTLRTNRFGSLKCERVSHYIKKSVYDNDWALMTRIYCQVQQ